MTYNANDINITGLKIIEKIINPVTILRKKQEEIL